MKAFRNRTLLASFGITTLNPLFEEILVATIGSSSDCNMFYIKKDGLLNGLMRG